tara:strand:- start:22 stop:348 length:327 start_codon:yes stop_codon:yes gene_type:complete
MGRRSTKQLNVQNVNSMLTQHGFKFGSVDTKCKILYKTANFLVRTNNLRYMNQALSQYNKIYDMLCDVYTSQHPRSFNALLKIIETENKIASRKRHAKIEKTKSNEKK